MRYLAVDLGDRRVGLALSDAEGRIASPLRSVRVRSHADAADKVRQVIEETGAEVVVVGHARNMDGRSGDRARMSEVFADALRDGGARVELWDERLTSVEAERHLLSAGLSHWQRRKRIDAVAAQRILSSYLEALAHRGGDDKTTVE